MTRKGDFGVLKGYDLGVFLWALSNIHQENFLALSLLDTISDRNSSVSFYYLAGWLGDRGIIEPIIL